ncbi:MAG: DUF4389 domain-containing protein [Acidimicrobiales bacterium]
MRPGRIVALVIGCLLVIPAIAVLLGGGALGLGYAFGRGDDGYFDTTLDRFATDTVAITADDITFAADPGSPDWVLDALDADVRLRVTNTNERTLFIGIARQADVDAYLAGVAHDEVTDITDSAAPVYRTQPGTLAIAPPIDQTFWEATATGSGDAELTWEATSGTWAAVLMNADGSPGVIADLNVGAKAAFVLPLAVIMMTAGALTTALAVGLIIFGALGAHRSEPSTVVETGVPGVPGSHGLEPLHLHPVTLTARLDPELSRWKWLVKWLLAIPHFIVLAFLSVAFVLLTLVAGVAIVFTGRYPRGIFDFNVGVLRWAWRVEYYASTGGIGTDHYPPFSLREEPGDDARFDIDYPERLSRGLVFVKWLLAIPHLIIVAVLSGGSVRWLAAEGDRVRFDMTAGGGLLGLLVLVAGIVLLFDGRYPKALFDLIVGFNRWIYRAIAYVALMTDVYPPFRLDQGGSETPAFPVPPTRPGASAGVDLRPEQIGPGDSVTDKPIWADDEVSR